MIDPTLRRASRLLPAALLALAMSLTACHEALVCPKGQAGCGGACVDLATDPGHCGACATTCGAATPFCATDAGATACVAACPVGLTPCGHSCIAGSCQPALAVACLATGDARPLDVDLLPAGQPRLVTAGVTVLALAGTTLLSGSGYPAAALDQLPIDPLSTAAG